jgi:hypothetical protein
MKTFEWMIWSGAISIVMGIALGTASIAPSLVWVLVVAGLLLLFVAFAPRNGKARP